MKLNRLVLFISTLIYASGGWAQVTYTTLNVEPQFPSRGDKVKISYDPTSTTLKNEKTIEAVVYSFNNSSTTATEIPLTRTGTKFIGYFTVDSAARAMVFSFNAGEKHDFNANQGYILPAYNDKKEPVPGAYLSYAMIYDGYGNYLFGLESQPELGLEYAGKEYNEQPQYRGINGLNYLAAINKVKKKDGQPVMIKAMEEMEAAGNLSEEQYATFASWYKKFKMDEKADQLTAAMKEKFPKGNWLKAERKGLIYQEKDPAKQEQMIIAFVNDFPAKNPNEKQMQQYLYQAPVNTYVDQKNWEKFKAASKKMNMEQRASYYNNLAWTMAEKDENLDFAKVISAEATIWAKKEVTKPTTKKPEIRTTKQWTEDRKYTYAMYADTYAYLLYKLQDYQTGYQYAKDAVAIRKKKDPKYNERYALLLEKVAPPKQVKKELEQFVKDGVAGKQAKEVLQRAYEEVNVSDKGFDEYVSDLSRISLEKIKENLTKKMVVQNAPAFRLVNLENKEVNLEDLKGKIVVIDFWATWCGPCKASFPAMQKAVEKFQNNQKVAFLFIDTWEKIEGREKLVTEFIEKNRYKFNVLYDTPESDDANEYVVVNNYKVDGIPTKFIIDPSGKIRFKSVGYDGNEDALVQEISMMIEMAGQVEVGMNSNK